MQKESALESRCVQKIEDRGGVALKLVLLGLRGFPDRTVLLPGGRISFIEFKREQGGVVAMQQHRWKKMLIGLGFLVHVISTDKEFEDIYAQQI